MDYASLRSLPAMFFGVARERAERPFLWAKRDGQYQSLNWAEAAVHDKAAGNVARVPLPAADPVTGRADPLLEVWRTIS